MDDKQKELERIQKALLAEEEDQPLEDILNDEELNALLNDEPAPAFDDPEEIRDPKRQGYQNFANNYGNDPKEETEEDRKALNEKVILGLMITASVLCLGIIGVLGYWLGVLL